MGQHVTPICPGKKLEAPDPRSTEGGGRGTSSGRVSSGEDAASLQDTGWAVALRL